MRIRIILLLAINLLGQSCAEPDDQFEKLLKSPDQFHGQEIEITGTIHDRFEDIAIYLTENSSKNEAIWIEYSQILMFLNKYEGLDGARVKVKGEFDKDDKGHLGQYAGTIREAVIIIEE